MKRVINIWISTVMMCVAATFSMYLLFMQQEISFNKYQNLSIINTYPRMKSMVEEALKDDKVTEKEYREIYDEFFRLNKKFDEMMRKDSITEVLKGII